MGQRRLFGLLESTVERFDEVLRGGRQAVWSLKGHIGVDGVQSQLELMVDEQGGELAEFDEDYLRDHNPVFHRGTAPAPMGTSQPVHYGGLVMARLHHFDPGRSRPGLPRV